METITFEKTPTTNAKYEAAIDQMMMQMQQMRVEIVESHRQTDRLQMQTREKLDHLETILTQIEAA